MIFYNEKHYQIVLSLTRPRDIDSDYSISIKRNPRSDAYTDHFSVMYNNILVMSISAQRLATVREYQSQDVYVTLSYDGKTYAKKFSFFDKVMSNGRNFRHVSFKPHKNIPGHIDTMLEFVNINRKNNRLRIVFCEELLDHIDGISKCDMVVE